MKNTIFLFNLENGEYVAAMPYENKELPENATLKEVPSVDINEVAIFDKDKDDWEVFKDYRFTHKMLDGNNNVLNIENIGEIPEEYTLITNKEAEELLEKKRIQKLYMTKYDFYKYAIKPNNIAYSQLEEILQTNDEMRAAWQLCNNVYRGDKTLCDNIGTIISSLTPEALDKLFIEYGTENEANVK